MAKRYELPDAAWDLVADIFTKNQRTGRPRADDRLMLNGILWVLCSGAAWRDMPERFGPWSTIYQRFRGWRDCGAFDQMLRRLHIRLNEQGLIDLETWMIDSTAVRATRASSGAGKKGDLKNRKTTRSGAAGWPDDQDSHAVRRQWCASAFPVVRRTSQRYSLCPTATRSGLHTQPARSPTQALPLVAG